MNTIWSENVQGVQTLYLSRKLRFAQPFAGQYQAIFDLDPDADLEILEIGCGPGALAEALKSWYPKAKITALDRDSQFIRFAQDHIPGVHFLEGDAGKLPFANETFDLVISYTVSEHVETEAFFSEQYRVLKKGGICLCLSTVRTINHEAACMTRTPEESKFWRSIFQQTDFRTTAFVGQYRLDEQQLPETLEHYGFHPVSSDYIVVDLTPDHPKYPAALAEAMIYCDRDSDLEILQIYRSHFHFSEKAEQPGALTEADFDRMEEITRDHYDQRLDLYRKGQAQWDVNLVITQCVRGIK